MRLSVPILPPVHTPSIPPHPPPHPRVAVSPSFSGTLSTYLTSSSTFPFDHTSYELVQVSLTLQHIALHFFSLYRPPCFPTSSLTSLTTVTLPGDLCVLADFNVHFDLSHNPATTKLLDLLRMFNLRQPVQQPTHRQGHIIDWVIERPDDGVLKSTVVSDALESDHKCVITQFAVNISTPPPVFGMSVTFAQLIAQLSRMASTQNLPVSTTRPLNSAVQVCSQFWTNTHAPVSKCKVSVGKYSPYSGRQPVAHSYENVDSGEPQALQFTKKCTTKQKHHVTNPVQRAKSAFYNTKIPAAEASSKELCSITNKLAAWTKCSFLPTIRPQSDLPDIFCDFFLQQNSENSK